MSGRRHPRLRPALALLAGLALSCAAQPKPGADSAPEHGHSEHSHSEHGHGAHGHGGPGHGEHGAGASGHGPHHQGGPEPHVFTHFAAGTELFMELPQLVVDQEATPAAHVTLLGATERPLSAGVLRIELRPRAAGAARDDVLRVTASRPSRPGVFTPPLRPQAAGDFDLRVVVQWQGQTAVHELGAVKVFADAHAAAHAPAASTATTANEGVAFLKEQQWRLPFATAPVEVCDVQPSFEAYGTVVARPEADVHISAPVDGRVATAAGMPKVGARLERGAVVARLLPQLHDVGDVAALRRQLELARIARRKAHHEKQRYARLLKSGAAPQDRWIDARFALERAQADERAAASRLAQAQGDARVAVRATAGHGGALAVRTPIAGTVAAVEVASGERVKAGAHLLRVVDLRRLWLQVHVPERYAHRLAEVTGAWWSLEGQPGVQRVGAADVVTSGAVLDARTRTVPLFVAVPAASSPAAGGAANRLRPGLFADVHVATGPPQRALTLPRSAVVYEAGLPTAYVQRDGEHFERRTLRLGADAGERVAVLAGVRAGERVVSRGAWAVRLAASAGALPAHGHHH